MDRYVPDEALYSKPVTGFTSDDEFTLASRAQITNETPTVDSFENLHAVMQNDLWKWFVGSNKISFDVPFNFRTGGWEYKDQSGHFVEMSNSKYVNGVRVKDFGPQPERIQSVWSTLGGSDFWYLDKGTIRIWSKSRDESFEVADGSVEIDGTSYGVKESLAQEDWDMISNNEIVWHLHDVYEIPYGVRYEVNGSVLPEFDLLLHEGYRYLSALYPDHPRWADLLTDNEIDDQVVDVGAIIDYVPNVKLFRQITDSIDYGITDPESLFRATSYEAVKLETRNLLDHARRRKFFGARVGYLMFVNDSTFDSNVYNVSRYKPYKELAGLDLENHPADYVIGIDSKGNPIKAPFARSTEWFMDVLPLEENGFDNRPPAWFSRNWDRPFKLLDWRNESYDYELPGYVPDLATGFTSPYDTYGLWEIKDDSWGSTPGTSFDAYYVGQWVMVDGVKVMIQRIEQYSRSAVFGSESMGMWKFSDNDLDSVYRILTSAPIPPAWDSFYFYPPLTTDLEKAVTDGSLKAGSQLESDLNTATSFVKSTEAILRVFKSNPKKLSPHPLRPGAMMMTFDTSIGMYPDKITTKIKGSAFNPIIEYGPNTFHKKWEMLPGSILSTTLLSSHLDSLVEVTKVTKGQFDIDGFNGDGFFKSQESDVLAEVETAFEMEVPNGTVMILGVPEYRYADFPDADGRYYAASATVKITTIPWNKDRWMMERCYTNFLPRVREKAQRLEELFGSASTGTNPYSTFIKLRESVASSFEAFSSITRGFVEEPPTSNRDQRVVDHTAAYKAWIKALPTDKKKSVGEKAYEEWKNARDFKEPAPMEKFSEVSRTLLEKITSYQEQTIEDLSCDLALAEDRSYYDLELDTLTIDQQVALRRIRDIDTNIDSWRANKWLLLDPTPKEPWIEKPVIVEAKPSFIEDYTRILAIYKLSASPLFSESIDYIVREELGFCQLDDWRDGYLNTIVVCEKGQETTQLLSIDGSTKLLIISSNKDLFEKRTFTSVVTVPYYDLRADILDGVGELDPHYPGLCSTTGSFWESLPSYHPNNVTSIEDKTYEIKLNLMIDLETDPRTFTALDEEAKHVLTTLSAGDKIYPDVFSPEGNMVESVDWDQGVVKTTEDLLMSGTFTVTFIIRLNIVMDTSDSDNFWKYRYDLQASGLLDSGDPWDHGFYPSKEWPDETSGAQINSPIDAKWFKDEILTKLKTNQKFTDGFNEVVKSSYQKNQSALVLPSLIDDQGELFWEVTPTKVLGYSEERGKESLGKLVPIELHDYLDDNTRDVSRAVDFVNVGTNITMETDNSGRFTAFANKKWTDDSIHSRFRTIGWSESTIPYYIEIGTGALDLFQIVTKSGSPSKNNYSATRSYYEGSIEERASKDERGEVYAGLGEGGWEGAFYSGDDIYAGIEKDLSEFGIKHVAEPVFESPIGEYELRRFIENDRDPGVLYTLVSSTIIKQEFSDLRRQTEITMNFEKTFEEDVLVELSNRSYTDNICGRVLVDPETDISHLTYDGIFEPAAVREEKYNYRYAINWPDPPQADDETIHYMVVTRNTVVSNVIDPRLGSLNTKEDQSFTFPTMSIIVFEWGTAPDRAKTGKWVQRDFRFGGIYGSSATLFSTLFKRFESVEIEQVNLKATSMILEGSEEDSENSKDDFPGDRTLKHRLLAKLLSQSGILTGDPIYARTFSSDQIEKLLLGAWEYVEKREQGLSFDVNALISSMASAPFSHLIDKNWDKHTRETLPDPEKLWWFLVGPISGQPAQATDGNGWHSLENAGLGTGSIIVLSYEREFGTFKVFKINNNSKWAYLISTEHLPGMDDTEWLTFCEENGISRYSKDGVETSWLPINTKDDIFTSIQLERTKILGGSFKLGLRIDPDFTSDGWRFKDYVDTGPIYSYLIKERVVSSESPIYVDEDLKILYVYNAVNPMPEGAPDPEPDPENKYVLKIRENRFFKNALFVIGNYSLDELEIDGVIKKVPRVHAIDDVSFDIDYLSTIDRLLRFNNIRIRSNYSKQLEADFYSSYVPIRGILRGIYFGDTEKFLMVGFDEARGAKRITNRIEAGTEFKKLTPVRRVGTQLQLYSDTDTDFETAKWPGDVDFITKPIITKFDARRKISEEGTEDTFLYYRNALILEGKLNTAVPQRIDFSENENLNGALDHILVGDTVLKIMSIDYSKYDSVNQFKFQPKRYFVEGSAGKMVSNSSIPSMINDDIVKIDFREGWIVGATNTGLLLASSVGSLLNMGRVLDESVVYKVATVSDKGELTGLSFDEREHGWILTYSSGESSTGEAQVKRIILDVEPEQTSIENILDNSGFDINTYQVVSILDVDARAVGSNANQDRNSYKKVYARDVAWTSVSLATVAASKSLLDSAFGAIQNDSSGKSAVVLTDTAGSPKRGTTSLTAPSNSYSLLKFELTSESGSAPISVGVQMSGTPEAYRFDRTLNEWVKIEATSGGAPFVPIVSNWKSSDQVAVTAYLVGSGFKSVSTDKAYSIFDEDEIAPAVPPPPPAIPQIQLEGLEILDPLEEGVYPPPRVPYGSKNLRISQYHPIFDYLETDSFKNGPAPDNPRYGDDSDSKFKYTVQEDVYVDSEPGDGKHGNETYLSVLKAEDPSNPTETQYVKGTVRKINFNDPANPPYIWEVAWWCKTNSCAPPKDYVNDYGLRAYVEEPSVSPNDEVVYQLGFRASDKIIMGRSISGAPTPMLGTDQLDLDNYCIRKNAVTRVPPYDLATFRMPLEYQSIYVDPSGLPDPQRFFTEFLIYSVYYQDYVSEYNSYIAGDSFKQYIDLLRSSWLYIGEQSSNLHIVNNELSEPNRMDPNIADGGSAIAHGFYALPALDSISRWLRKLPPPDSSLGVEIAAVVLSGSQNFLAYSLNDSSTKFRLIDARQESVPEIAVTNTGSDYDSTAYLRKDGLYNPYLPGSVSSTVKTTEQALALRGTKFTCHNEKGNVAVVMGDQLFFYGQTAAITDDGTNVLAIPNGLTEKFHWKRASLPHKRHIEFDLIQKMELKEAIEYVVQVRAQWLRLAEAVISSNDLDNSTEAVQTIVKIRNWVENNPVQGYDGSFTGPTDSNVTIENRSPVIYTETNQIPTSIYMSSPLDTTRKDGGEMKVLFIETVDGVVPHFNSSTDHHFVSREEDATGLLSKQNYFQYLLYYSAYILGNERFEGLIDDGVKKVFMSDQCLCILTKMDDLLTLPLSKTLTRAQIEDYGNWSVSNIDAQYVVPTMTGEITRRKKAIWESKVYDFALWPTEETQKGFKINQIECIDNSIVIAGYVQANPTIQQMANEQTTYSVINELYPNDSWRTFYLPDREEYPRYPVIFYSNDGGKSFTKCQLPPIEFIPNIKSYNGEYTDPSGMVIPESVQSNIEAFSIHVHGTDVHVWFSNPDSSMTDPSYDGDGIDKNEDGVAADNSRQLPYTPLGYTTFEILSDGLGSELSWLENITRVQKKSEDQRNLITASNDPNSDIELVDVLEALKGTSESDVGEKYMREDFMELKLSRTKSITEYGQSMISPIGREFFIVQQPFMYKASDIQVTQILDNVIEVSPPDESAPRYQAEDIRVLISINPARSVMDQARYLAAKTEYLNWQGNFIVPEYVQVEDEVLANRMYSYRETLEVRAPGQTDEPSREIEPKKGIPAISEDEEHKVYQYYDPYFDKNNDQVWDYVPATNADGENIKLVNGEGNYLLERDSWKSNNFIRLYNMIEQGTPASTLVNAPRVAVGYDITIEDARFNAVLNGFEYTDSNPAIPSSVSSFFKQQLVRYFDSDPTDPKLLIESKYMTNIISYMADPLPFDAPLADRRSFFYSWPGGKTTQNLQSITEEMGPPNDRGEQWRAFVGYSTVQYNDLANKTEFFEYIAFLEEAEGAFGTSSNMTDPRMRFEMVEVTDSTGTKQRVIFDKEIGVIPVRYKDVMNLNVRTLYTPYSGVQQYIAGQFSVIDHQLISSNPDYPVTGIYIDPKGYGGSMNNTSWDKEQPWDIDYEAFSGVLDLQEERIKGIFKIMKNEADDLIYMTDVRGDKLVSNYGLDYVRHQYDEIEIRYDDLVYSDQVVRSWSKGEEETEGLDYHVYKRPSPKYEIWLPKEEMRLGMRKYKDDNLPDSDDPKVVISASVEGIPYKVFIGDCLMFFKDGMEEDLDALNSIGLPLYYITFFDDDGNSLDNLKLVKLQAPRYHNFTSTQKVAFPVFALGYDTGSEASFSQFKNLRDNSPFVNDIVTMRVTDLYGIVIEKKISLSFGHVSTRVIEARPVIYYGDILYSRNSSLEIWLDPRTLEEPQRFVSNDQSSVVMKGQIYDPSNSWGTSFSDTTWPTNANIASNISNVDAGFYVSISLNGKPSVTFFNSIVGVESLEIQENIHTIEKLDFCFERNWLKNGEGVSNIYLSVYSGEVKLEEIQKSGVTVMDGWTYSITPDGGRIKASHAGSIELVTPLRRINPAINALKFEKTVFVRGDSALFKHPTPVGGVIPSGYNTDDILVKGLRSGIIMLEPVYQNFKELLTMKKRTISLDEAAVVEKTTNEEINRITEIDQRKTFFVLENQLPSDALNDGEPHEMKIKILTTNTQQTAPEFMNHPDHIVEVTLVETEKFSYDRIFFDPEGYPQPPVKINGRYYNLENTSMYESEKNVFKNTTGFKVWQCDESGRLLRWVLQGGAPVPKVLGDKVGDCRGDVFGSVDRRHNPRKPLFNSSYEWFYNQFYLKGQEKNPFWQTIVIRDSYDQKVKSWTQKISTKKWEKAVDKMVELDVPVGEEYVFIENGVTYEFDSGVIRNELSDYIDYEKGFINFILGFPAKTYYNSKYLIKYGIYVKNQFYPGEKNKQVWNSWVKMKFQEAYDFIVNSRENVANPTDKDLAIVPVREMGLFDKTHRLVAYATFPDVEYRSDRQHISFSLVIRNQPFQVSDRELVDDYNL